MGNKGPVIKICGLFREEDAGFVNEAGPDYAGFVFAPSRRQVSPEKAARIRERLRPGILPVGVFVRAPAEEIAALYRDGVIALAQLHGGEDRAYIAALRALCPVPLIQVISCGETGGQSLPAVEADYLLFDNTAAGSGKPFDWSVLPPIIGGLGAFGKAAAAANPKPQRGVAGQSPAWGVAEDPAGAWLTAAWSTRNRGGRSEGGLPPPSPQSLVPSPPQKKWFIAGGIDQGNIEKALALGPYGVDVSSGAESGGVKDREKILRLVKIVRRWGGKP